MVENKIDLGLPSGLLWCSHNVGATSPHEPGLYFSWGNIEGHSGDGYNFNSSNYKKSEGYKLSGNISESSSNDAARVNMGNGWRIPTKAEYDELLNNTDNEWVTNYNGKGISGMKFMKKSDHSVFIFLPAAGYYNGTSLSHAGSYGFYWSSSLSTSDTSYAYYLYLFSGGVYVYYGSGYFGYSVRAVSKK